MAFDAGDGVRSGGAACDLISLLDVRLFSNLPSRKIFLRSLLLSLTFYLMQATLTSKGQITIPVQIRNRLHLKTGDILEFDGSAPFLKATKTIAPEAWENFGKAATNPWGKKSVLEILEELRGPVELPANTKEQQSRAE